MNSTQIAVTSASFCNHPVLRAELSQSYSNIRFNDSGRPLSREQLVATLDGCEKAITALDKIDEALLTKLPKLKVISKFGVGVDMLNFKDMKTAGILLGWEGGLNKRSVSELTLAFAIAALRKVPTANATVRAGGWKVFSGPELTQKTVGIIGCGFVGQDVIRLLQPFNCRILVHDIREYSDFYREFNVEAVSLEKLLESSDVVTLHVPFDHTTKSLLNQKRLELMKKNAVLINCARGGIVDETALKDHLAKGQLAGAAFDVFSNEPDVDTGLLNMPGFFGTPHIGGSSHEALLAMGRAAIRGLDQAKTVDYYFDHQLLERSLID